MSEHYDWAFGSYKDKDMVYKNLHMGLKGDWQGINFSGCDDPTYRDE